MPVSTERLSLVDHHCHGVVPTDLDRPAFEDLITESPWAAPAGASFFDTQLGFAIRRWCGPLLNLDPSVPADEYLCRRSELGATEVNKRLLRASGITDYVIDTGYQGDAILDPAGMADAGAAEASTVARLETVAEQLVGAGTSASSFVADYASALATATAGAVVGVKSVIAYRYGLDIDPARPSGADTTDAAGRWLARCESTGRVRVDDPVLLRHLLWAGVDRGLPIQVHVGYGDADLELHRCNPLLMTSWLRAIQPSGVPIMLLHNYPYHREAGYLAHVFPNVYCNVGLAVNYTGSRAAHIIAESLELTPFHKSLFSSDAFGISELYLTGAVLFRRGLGRVLDEWVREGDWSTQDADRVAEMIAAATARRVYRLDGR